MHPATSVSYQSARRSSAGLYFLVALLVVGIDQASKWAVHTYMQPGGAGEIHVVGAWANLLYTTNPGMAFGAQLPTIYGKLLLTSFRLLAVGGLIYYIISLVGKRAHSGFVACLSLILGGAVGNLVDSIFYGVLYQQRDEVTYQPLSWFHGHVIDMIYIPIYQGYLPAWMPFIGGQYTSGFPVFNLADSCIFIGVVLILVLQNRFFKQHPVQERLASAVEPSAG